MTRFTKLVVLGLAVASLGLVGITTVQANEAVEMTKTHGGYSLEGGFWISGNDAKKSAVGLKFQSSYEVRVVITKNEQKVLDKMCRYTFENGRLVISFDDGSSLKANVTWDGHDRLTMTYDDGDKSTWKRITN